MTTPALPPGRKAGLSSTLALLVLGLGMLVGAAFLGGGSRTGHASQVPTIFDADLVVAIPFNRVYEIRTVHFFIQHEGPGDFDDVVRQVKDNFIASIPGAVEIPEDDAVSAAYAHTGFSWPSGQATWYYVANDIHRPAGLVNHREAIAAGAVTWGNAGANFVFVDGGSTAQDNPPCTGWNAVGWAQLDQYGSGVLGVACTGYSGAGIPVFDLNFDTDFNWSTAASPGPGQVDLESVSVHEFGHVLGLGHTQSQHCPFQGARAIMCPSYITGTANRNPHPDDINSIVALYGSSGPTSTPTNTPIPTSTSTPTNTPTPGNTPSPTNTPQPTNTPSPTNTPQPTSTPTPTPTSTPAPTATPSPTSAPGSTSTPTSAPPTAGPTSTHTPTGSPTAGPPATATSTPSPTAPAPTPESDNPDLVLSPGPNLLVWPAPGALTPAQAFGPNLDLVIAIYEWDAPNQSWLRYSPLLPPWANTVHELIGDRIYWIITAQGFTQTFN